MRVWSWLVLASLGACSSEGAEVHEHRSGDTRDSDASAPEPSNDAGPSGDASPSPDASDHDAAPSGPCPAPATTSTEKEIFGDTALAGWSVSGFHRDVSTDAPACSGTASVAYTSHRYDGIGFYANDDGNAIDAQSLEFRIWLDRDAVVSAAAAPRNPPNDIHQYFLATPNEWSWRQGWNEARFTIPASFGKTGQILFEVQSCSTPACDETVSIDFRIDDLRLVAR